MPIRPSTRLLLVSLTVAVLAALAVFSWQQRFGRDAEAHAPHPGLDFSMGVDTGVDPVPASTRTVTSTPGPRPGSGDANCDGTTDSLDALLVLQVDARLNGDGLSCFDAANVHLDYWMNALDAALILQYEAGLLDSLPPVPDAVSRAVVEATADLLVVLVDQVAIVKKETALWPDSCLGLGTGVCAAVIVPGYRITVVAKDEMLVWRTDVSGKQVALEARLPADR